MLTSFLRTKRRSFSCRSVTDFAFPSLRSELNSLSAASSNPRRKRPSSLTPLPKSFQNEENVRRLSSSLLRLRLYVRPDRKIGQPADPSCARQSRPAVQSRDIVPAYPETRQNPVLQNRSPHYLFFQNPFFRQTDEPVKILLQSQTAGERNIDTVILVQLQSKQILIKFSRGIDIRNR